MAGCTFHPAIYFFNGCRNYKFHDIPKLQLAFQAR
jgi:hypothetical protein